MKRTRHKHEQIIRKLRQAEQILNEGQAVNDFCQALEVSTATFTMPLTEIRWEMYGIGLPLRR